MGEGSTNDIRFSETTKTTATNKIQQQKLFNTQENKTHLQNSTRKRKQLLQFIATIKTPKAKLINKTEP